MMQRCSRSPDLGHERFAPRLKLFQIRRTEGLVGCSGENQIGDFEIAYWPVVGRGLRVDFFRNPQRRFAHFIVRTNVAHDRGINRIAKNDECVISGFGGVASVRETAGHHDVGVGRADEETVFFERGDFSAQLRDGVAQLAFAFRRDRLERVLIFRAFQSLLRRGQIGIGRRRFLWPAITRERLEIRARRVSDRHTVGV